MAKPQARCIFCKGFGLTKEHIFADWLREIFPRAAADTHTLGVSEDGRNFGVAQRQGHSGSKKIRCVCRACNSRWMSAIDDAAKYVATPLVRGERVSVTPEMQRVLALWFAKIAMVGDSHNRAKSAIPQSQRDSLRLSASVPPEWQIWIAPYNGDAFRDLALYQNRGDLDFTRVSGPGEEFRGYVESTFLGMGTMVVVVIANNLPAIHFDVRTFSQFARQIWPIGETFSWPSAIVLDDAAAYAAMHILEHMVAKF